MEGAGSAERKPATKIYSQGSENRLCPAAGLGKQQGAGSGQRPGLAGPSRALCHLGEWQLAMWHPPLPPHICWGGQRTRKGPGAIDREPMVYMGASGGLAQGREVVCGGA